MSNNLNKLLTDLAKDRKLEKTFLKDPEKVMDEYGLGDDQKKAVRSRDEKAIQDESEKGASVARYTIVWDD